MEMVDIEGIIPKDEDCGIQRVGIPKDGDLGDSGH